MLDPLNHDYDESNNCQKNSQYLILAKSRYAKQKMKNAVEQTVKMAVKNIIQQICRVFLWVIVNSEAEF